MLVRVGGALKVPRQAENVLATNRYPPLLWYTPPPLFRRQSVRNADAIVG